MFYYAVCWLLWSWSWPFYYYKNCIKKTRKAVDVVVNVKKLNVTILIFVVNRLWAIPNVLYCLSPEIGDGKVNLKLHVYTSCHKSLLLVKERGFALLFPWSWLHGSIPYFVLSFYFPMDFYWDGVVFFHSNGCFAVAFLSCSSELKSAHECILDGTV